MKALILNSGIGSRMGVLTSEHPKCMTEISGNDTILSRQLKLIAEKGIKEVIITTGPFETALVNYCQSLNLPLQIKYVKNPYYRETNYIYSIYCAKEYLNDDILLIHGDLVFENTVLDLLWENTHSCMVVSSKTPLPEKDFKAVLSGNKIVKIGIDYFDHAVAAQPLYKIAQKDWTVWLDKIIEFCNDNNRTCYAENAFNMVSDVCNIYSVDIECKLCSEIDNAEDLAIVSKKLQEIDARSVYMCFSTDMLHSGHINIIQKASRLGKLIIGVLSDEVIASTMFL